MESNLEVLRKNSSGIKDNVQVYEERQPNGQWLKSMDSNFRLSRKI